jgi:hypothetical protein
MEERMNTLHRCARGITRRTPAGLAVLLVLACASTGVARAQSFNFFYVAPVSAIQAAFGAVTAADTGVFDVGYAHKMITAANEAKFRAAAPANLVKTFDEFKPGTPLRKREDEIMRISGGITDVTIALVDDRTGISANSRFADMPRGDGARYVWPAASVTPKLPNGRYRGSIGLGTCAADTITNTDAGAWKSWEGTIMHETMHTQFVNDKTKWGSVNIVYGGDGNHWYSELLGEQELPFEEGLGTFFGCVDNPDWTSKALVPFFRTAGERYHLESWSVLAGEPELNNAPHSEETQDPPTPPPTPGGRYAVRSYKWKDVPGFFVLFNENTSTGFHYFFWKYASASEDTALSMIRRSVGAMSQNIHKRDLAFDVNRLALQLEDYAATPAGRAAKTAGTLTSSEFPYALLDVITHFGMSVDQYKRELLVNYPDRVPKGEADYWNRRDAVKQLVQADLTSDPINIEHAVQAVRDYFRTPDTLAATGR